MTNHDLTGDARGIDLAGGEAGDKQNSHSHGRSGGRMGKASGTSVDREK
jgi:hypothetical protein